MDHPVNPMNRFVRSSFVAWLVVFAGIGVQAAYPVPPAPARPTKDANGNPLRYAATGHVSNYDEAKVGSYTLPDPLVLKSGRPVRDVATWTKVRRPELIGLYEQEIFGRVPERAPKVSFAEVQSEGPGFAGAVRKHIVVTVGEGAAAMKVNVVLFTPSAATKPVPVALQLLFGDPAGYTPPPPPPSADGKAPVRRFNDAGPVADFIARGWGYASVRYTEIQPDAATTNQAGVQAQAYAPGQTKPAPGEWGTIAAWAWGASRVLDYLETDRAVDAKRVALVGHSRLGKTVLWAGARDPRFALVFSSCAGEMGSSLARRDFGESLDDMAANFPWQFVSTFPKYAGRWSDLPVDTHTIIALNAPRPVFVTAGTEDLWADPHGEFLALVAAGPVYRLLGKPDVGASVLPALDTPLISGSLGFHYHTGKHTITESDWKAFFDFAGRHLQVTVR
ncbi:MAG: acetylxylan esterase [Verrucomicrobia bacterium]|nr:acetylxylan esterase [Verrucomicrobiota bacterium]